MINQISESSIDCYVDRLRHSVNGFFGDKIVFEIPIDSTTIRADLLEIWFFYKVYGAIASDQLHVLLVT